MSFFQNLFPGGDKRLKALFKALNKVKGGILVFRVQKLSEENQIAVAYGSAGEGENSSPKIAGISALIHELAPDESKDEVQEETPVITGGGMEIKIPSLAAVEYKNIISEISGSLEEKTNEILTSPSGFALTLKGHDFVRPFSLDNNNPLVRLSLSCSGSSYKTEVSGFEILDFGTRQLYYHLTLKYLDYVDRKSGENSEFVEIKNPSGVKFGINMVKRLKAIGVFDVITVEEKDVLNQIDPLVKEIWKNVKRESGQSFLKKGSLFENDGKFCCMGLKRALTAYLIMGEPSQAPFPILEWFLDEMADDMIKEVLEGENLKIFTGWEKEFLEGIVEGKKVTPLIKSGSKFRNFGSKSHFIMKIIIEKTLL